MHAPTRHGGGGTCGSLTVEGNAGAWRARGVCASAARVLAHLRNAARGERLVHILEFGELCTEPFAPLEQALGHGVDPLDGTSGRAAQSHRSTEYVQLGTNMKLLGLQRRTQCKRSARRRAPPLPRVARPRTWQPTIDRRSKVREGCGRLGVDGVGGAP